MASVFVTASEIETQGLVLLEAAACGLPIVAFKATCIPDIVKDGINGYLAKPGDVIELAAHVHKLIAEPKLARECGKASLSIARDFCRERALNTHEAIYLQVISQKARADMSPATTWRGHATHFDASD
jgi:glycosyltransferase involved in cell wall biosynthesis